MADDLDRFFLCPCRAVFLFPIISIADDRMVTTAAFVCLVNWPTVLKGGTEDVKRSHSHGNEHGPWRGPGCSHAPEGEVSNWLLRRRRERKKIKEDGWDAWYAW